MFKKQEYDVIVVGAGPAGSVTAQFCAKKGYNTLLIEKRNVIGYPVRCGEATTTRDRLESFGPVCEDAIESNINGVVLYGAGGTKIKVVKPEPIGMVVDRIKFDQWYAKLAVDAGVELKTGARVCDIKEVENNQREVLVKIADQEYSLKATIVVGADGIESLSGQWVGLKTRHNIKTTCTGIEIRLDKVYEDPDCLTFWQGHDYINDGYVWAFPKVKSGTTNFGAGILIANSITKEKNIKDMAMEFAKKYFPDAKVLDVAGGIIPVSGNLKKYWANNFVLVGDVAHHTNPMTGGGIVSGMCAGKYAAETIDEAFKAKDFSENFFEIYGQRCENHFGKIHMKEMKIREFILSRIPSEQEYLYKVLKVVAEKGKIKAVLKHPIGLVSLGLKYWRFK